MYFIICNLVSICGLCLSQSEAWRLDNLGLQIRTAMPRKEEGGGGVQRTYRVDATGQSWCSISCRSKKEGGCSSMLKAWLNTLLDGLIFFLVFGPQIFLDNWRIFLHNLWWCFWVSAKDTYCRRKHALTTDIFSFETLVFASLDYLEMLLWSYFWVRIGFFFLSCQHFFKTANQQSCFSIVLFCNASVKYLFWR